MAIAKGKTNASRVQAGDRILVKVLEDGTVDFSGTKTGAGVQVARVTGKSEGERVTSWGRPTSRMTYTIHTSAGDIRNLAPIQTMWLAPEDPAGIKRAHVEALAEEEERQKRAQVKAASTEELVDALTDASPSLAALIQEELDFREWAEVEEAQARVAAADREAEAAVEAMELERQAERGKRALKAIGGCWAGGTLTGKALKAYADGDYALALSLAADQKALQEEDPEEAIHPESRWMDPRHPEDVEELGSVAADPEMVAAGQRHLERDAQLHAYAGAAPAERLVHVLDHGGLHLDMLTTTPAPVAIPRPSGETIYVAPMGSPRPGPEDLADLAQALVEEDLEHVDPEGEAPEPAEPRCQVRDVVTIHRGDRLYEVLQVERDWSRNNITGRVTDGWVAQVAPLDPEDARPAQWVNVDLLHVRRPVARVQTEEITGRVRQAREGFAMPDGSIRVIRTILTDSRRVPMVTLVPSPPMMAAPVATLRVGEAIVVDGRCFAAELCESGEHLKLEPAPHRDRLKG